MEKTEKQCPYCGETIKATAQKCRYCGEWLNKGPEVKTKEFPVGGDTIPKDAKVFPYCDEILDKEQDKTDAVENADIDETSLEEIEEEDDDNKNVDDELDSYYKISIVKSYWAHNESRMSPKSVRGVIVFFYNYEHEKTYLRIRLNDGYVFTSSYDDIEGVYRLDNDGKIQKIKLKNEAKEEIYLTNSDFDGFSNSLTGEDYKDNIGEIFDLLRSIPNVMSISKSIIIQIIVTLLMIGGVVLFYFLLLSFIINY